MDAKAVYDSAWQHPGIAFAAGLAFAFALARKLGGHHGLAVLLAAEIVADAFFTGTFSPTAPTALGTPVAIAFVILGDLRFFLLVELAARASRPPAFEGLGPPRAWGMATAWAFAIPVLSAIPQRLFPAAFTQLNAVFLVYEAMFVVLALVLRFVVLPRRFAQASEPVRRWVFGLALFEIVQYALWSTADVVILAGVEAGYWLRLVPNALYYAVFVPFAWRGAVALDEATTTPH